jgi:hypothetical protein
MAAGQEIDDQGKVLRAVARHSHHRPQAKRRDPALASVLSRRQLSA